MRAELAGDPDEEARQIVLRELTLRGRSRRELADTLRRRGVPGDSAERVLNRMTEVGLVDDAAFADAWVASRQRRRHLSRTALRQELSRKGLDRDVIEESLASVDTDDEHAAARDLAEKKLRAMRGLDAPVRRRRLTAALARRGFGSGLVSAVVAEVMAADGADAEDQEEPLDPL